MSTQRLSDIHETLAIKRSMEVRRDGCLLGLDHRIPNGTPVENYRFYIQRVWNIIERETL
jgi:hypothetical protein